MTQNIIIICSFGEICEAVSVGDEGVHVPPLHTPPREDKGEEGE